MTHNELLLSDKNVEHYEDLIHDALQDKLRRYIEHLNIKIECYQKLENALCEIVSNHLERNVDKDELYDLNFTESAWCTIMDELFGMQGNLIRAIHYCKPYSLITKQPTLQDYIPPQNLSSPLELLNDKSKTRATEIIQEYSSENTRDAYLGDLVYWQAWLSAIGFSFERAPSEDELITFVVQHVEGLDPHVDELLVSQRYKNKRGVHKLATVKRRIASLSVFLDRAEWNNPCRNKELRTVLAKLTKKYGGSKPASRAITREILDDMIDTCRQKKPIDIRDKAILLFAWASGGRRRAEVAAADIKDLVKDAQGEFVYTIPESKTDQEKKGHPVPVRGRAALALQEWIDTAGIIKGPIFRPIRKGGLVTETALIAKEINKIVKSRLKKAGYDESQYGAHGLRSGFVTEAGRRNRPLGDVMAMTTHRNVATVMRYYQAGSIVNNSAANLAD
jgi:integrase